VMNEPALSNYQRIHYHRRGYGRSITHNRYFDLKQEAADALDLLNHIDIDKVHVAGYSSGGVIAVELARIAPDKVRSLTLMEPALQLPDALDGNMPPNLAQAFESYNAGDTEGAIDAFWRVLSGPAWRSVITASLPEGLEQARRNAPLFFELEAKALLAYPFDVEAAASLTLPVLYIFSDAAAPHRLEMCSLFRTWVPQTRVLRVKDADHALPLQQPRVIATGIREFIAEHGFF